MRRSQALAPLSRDHHYALVIATALERADRGSAREVAARFVDFLSGHELSHFAVEESLLLPVVPDDELGRALVERVLDDHAYLRGAWQRLRKGDGPLDVEFMRTTGARLREHIRMEERELFPRLEHSLDPVTLDEIGARLLAERSTDPAVIARRFLDAFIARDLPGLLAVADPEVELHPLRLTGTPAYHGHEGVRRWLDDLKGRAPDASFAVDEIRGIDESRALARVRVRLGGEELSVRAIFTVGASRIREVHGYFSDEDLLAEVGHI
jgi:hypothetical protein